MQHHEALEATATASPPLLGPVTPLLPTTPDPVEALLNFAGGVANPALLACLVPPWPSPTLLQEIGALP